LRQNNSRVVESLSTKATIEQEEANEYARFFQKMLHLYTNAAEAGLHHVFHPFSFGF